MARFTANWPRCARKEPRSPHALREASVLYPARWYRAEAAGTQGLRLLHKIREGAFSAATEACPELLRCTHWPWSHKKWERSNTRSAATLLCTSRSSRRDSTRLMVLKCFPGLQCSHLNQHSLWEGSIGLSFGPGCSLSPNRVHVVPAPLKTRSD